MQLLARLNVTGKEGTAVAHLDLLRDRQNLLGFHFRNFFCGKLRRRLLGLLLDLALTDQAGNVRAYGLIILVQRDARGQYHLHKTARKQLLGALIGHRVVLGRALKFGNIRFLHHLRDQGKCALERALALDLDEHGRIRHLTARVGDIVLPLIVCGRKRQIQVNALTHHVDAREHRSALLIGFTFPARTRAHAAVGKQLVFDRAVIPLQLLARLNVTGKEGSLVADLDGAASGCRLHRRLAGAFLLLFLEALALKASLLLLGAQQLGVQDLIGTQCHLDRLAHTLFILGKLFAVVHQAGNRHRLLVFRIVNQIILQLLLGEVEIEVGEGLGKTLFGKQFDIASHDAVVKLCILQCQQPVKVADVIVVRHLGEFLAQDGKSGLFVPLDKLPKRKAILKILVFQDRIGANDGGTDKVSAQFLCKGGGKVRRNSGVDAADTLDRRSELRVDIGVDLIFGILER